MAKKTVRKGENSDRNVYLKLLHGLCRLFDVPVGLLHLTESMGQPGPLAFNVDLALGDRHQRLDQLQLDLLGRERLLEDPLGALLDHLGHGGLELGALLGQQDDVLAQERPVLGLSKIEEKKNAN